MGALRRRDGAVGRGYPFLVVAYPDSASAAQQITSLLTVIIGVFLILDGKLTVGALVAANMLAGRVLAPIAGIASVITRGTQTFSSLKSIDRIMSLERERSPQRAYVARKIDEGRISFENVSFAYPNAPGKALEKVSFKIEAGERIGIIGRVGSGKTTVGRLLLGFYEAEEGRILVDGVDSRQYDPSDLRTGIGFAMQDTDLFFGKLRDNIALGKPEATDEEILAAARLSGVESFIAGHPMGYDMPISEGGRSLSGGQKQAIGLARVLIRKPRVLFLDEPTAHFDIRSEAEFLERLKAIRGEQMTIIISTHRLSLLSMVDRLLLFDNGRLVADGPRDKVLAILQGKPRRLQTTATRSPRKAQPRCKSPMPSSDFAFANDIRAAAAMRTPRTSRMLLFTFLALFVSFLVWAHFAILDEVKRGNGRVVPSRQTQVVQTLEGGIVGDILVQEGAIVQQGQSLMRIDDTKFASEFGEIRERRAAMAARVARLEAEARGRTEVTFPDQLDKVVPASVATETSVFKMRAQKVAQDVDVLNQQVNSADRHTQIARSRTRPHPQAVRTEGRARNRNAAA